MHRRLVDKRITYDQVRFPEIARVHEYLHGRKGSRRFPARGDVLPEELSFALGRIIILDVVPGSPPDFVYRLYGTMISETDRDEMTNRSVAAIEPAQYREMVIRHYCEALQAAAPIFHEIEVQARELRASYQRGLFPLSDDDVAINKLLSVSGWHPEFDRCWDVYLEGR